jgi:hypothetical protein
MAFAGQPRFIDTATELQYHCDIQWDRFGQVVLKSSVLVVINIEVTICSAAGQCFEKSHNCLVPV